MKGYLELLEQGTHAGTRQADHRYSVFSRTLHTPLTGGLPVVTTRPVHWPTVARRTAARLAGDGSGWDGAALGRLAQELAQRPEGVEHVVAIRSGKALPRILWIQGWVGGGRLLLQVAHRTVDLVRELPEEIASHAVLAHLLARMAGLRAGAVVHVIGEGHVRRTEVADAMEQLGRAPRRAPVLRVDPLLEPHRGVEADALCLEEYDPHPPLGGQGRWGTSEGAWSHPEAGSGIRREGGARRRERIPRMEPLHGTEGVRVGEQDRHPPMAGGSGWGARVGGASHTVDGGPG